MKIYHRHSGSHVPFELFTFPDGQPHFKLKTWGCGDDPHCTIETRISNPAELLTVLIAKDTLGHAGYVVDLDILYLMGARMDRRMSASEPFTLEVVARIINGAGFHKVRILDPHSPIACQLLNAQAVLPTGVVDTFLNQYDSREAVVIIPDKGAASRVHDLLVVCGKSLFHWRQAHKLRDPATGALSGFGVDDASFVKGKICLIIDDICDGGGTFTGLAEVLHGAGAKQVDLYVTHGIFSKGLPLEGIQNIYCTNSYGRLMQGSDTNYVTVFSISMLG